MSGDRAQPGSRLASTAALEARLAHSRLAEVMGVVVRHLQQVLLAARPTPAVLRACIDFLTETGHHTDARRQEWVLLADALGISRAIHDLNSAHCGGATPDTVFAPKRLQRARRPVP